MGLRFCFVVLLAEIALLTPLVEFDDDGVMGRVASGLLVWSIVVGGAGAMLAGRSKWCEIARSPKRTGISRTLWFGGHVLAYVAFVLLTLSVAEQDDVGRGVVAGWVALAGTVFVSLFVSVRTARDWLALGGRFAIAGLIGLVVGGAFFGLAKKSRAVWRHTYMGNVTLVSWMLARFPGEPVVGFERGLPVVGTWKARILITSSCSEMESILAFWLLIGAAVFGVGRRQADWESADHGSAGASPSHRGLIGAAMFGVGRGRLEGEGASHGSAGASPSLLFWPRRLGGCLVVGVLGSLLIWWLNAVRFYLLILAGHATDVSMSVRLAHSRLGAIVFLIVSWSMVFCLQSRWIRYEPNRAESA